MLIKKEIIDEIIANPNTAKYTVDDLFNAIRGIDIDEKISFDELCNAGLFFQIRQQIKERIAQEEQLAKIRQATFENARQNKDINIVKAFLDRYNDNLSAVEEDVWSVVQAVDTEDAYQLYLGKFGGFSKYSLIAESEINRKQLEFQRKRKDLFADMIEHPNKYDYIQINAILDPDATIRDNDDRDPEWRMRNQAFYNKCLMYKEMKITLDDLINEGVVPPNPKVHKAMRLADSILQQKNIRDFEGARENRTDVFLIGIPRSGKSCVIGSLVARGYEKGSLKYIPYFVEKASGRIDPYRQYYLDLVNSFANCNPPQSTAKETLSVMQVDVSKTRRGFLRDIVDNHPLTLFEIGGEVFDDASKSSTDESDTNLWRTSFAPRIVQSKNRKVLFFLIDYLHVVNEGDNQDQSLTNILSTLEHDGDYDGTADGYTKGCTMSKVDQVVILITKADLMGTEERETRQDMAWEYVQQKYVTFLDELERLSKTYHINNGKGARVLTFSLGKYFVGNSFEFDPSDADRLIEFLQNNTRTY